MKLTRKEFEAQLALAKGLTGEPRKAMLASLKSAEVVEVDKDGKETVITVEIVDSEQKAVDDADKATKGVDEAALATLVTKAVNDALKDAREKNPPERKASFGIINKDLLKIPARAKNARVKNFKSYEGQEYTPGERAYRFGMWAIAAATGSQRAKAFCEENGIALVKSNDPDDGFTKAAPHQEDVNSVGGFLVPPEFDEDLIDLREQYGVFRQHARISPMSRDTKTRRRREGGLTASFVGEAGTVTPSRKAWGQVSLTAKKLMVLTTFTNELREDAAISIGDDLASEIAYAFSNKEDECGFNGDGTSTYGGIHGVRSRLTVLNGTDDGGGVVQQITGNTLAALVLADFHKVVGRIPQYADQRNPKWYCHRTFWAEVMQKLMLASGGVQSMEVINGVRYFMFLGYPVVISQVFPSATAVATLFCLFGDLALAADYGDRRQNTIAFSEHATVDSVSVFETDEIAVRGTERFDINVHDIGTTTAAGPIVGLVTGA